MAAVAALPLAVTVSDSIPLATSPPPPIPTSPSTSSPTPTPPPLPSSPPSPPPSSLPSPSSTSPSPSSSTSSRRIPAFDDCCVCFNGDSDDLDPILFCDGPGCNAVVHQSCYGIAVIPEGDWLCDSCAVKANPSLASHPSLLLSFNRCLLCPHTDGAFKPLASGEGWVHAACAIWVPETGFRDAEKVDAVIGVETIDRNRWRLICDVCEQRRGCCVQCVGSSCRWSCHVLCGWKAGLRMEMQVIGTTDEDLDVIKLVFCDRHREDTWNSKDRRHRGKTAVRLNDAATALALSQEHSHTEGVPRRPRQRREVDPVRESGYRCVRCGSRTRQHECSRRGEDDEEERVEMEEEEEPEDEDLKALYLHSLSLQTEEERRQREEEEAQEAEYWDLVQEDIDKDKEDRKAADRERRTLEAERGVVEESALYLELKQAQEKEEEAFIMGEEDEPSKPASSTTRRRKRRRDDTWKEESESSSMPLREKRVGRPRGSRTRVRRCLVHKTPPPCPLTCPSRPPPWTEEELKLKAVDSRRSRDRRRKSEEERMNTTAPGQRKALQAKTVASVHPSSPPDTAVVPPHSSSFLASVPLPVPLHPPIAVPPPAVLPPLSASPFHVITRSDKPLSYNPKNLVDIHQRLHTLLTSSSPPTQATLIQQLIVDSPPAYYREVAARLKEERGVEVLVKWMKESREQQAFALLGQVMKALKRLCSKDWDVGLVGQLMEEVGRNRGAVSQALRVEAEGLCKRMMELGLVQPSQVAAQAMAHLPALSAISAQIAGTATIGTDSALKGEEDSKRAGGASAAGNEGKVDGVVIVPSHPPPAAVLAAVERAKGRERDSRKGQPRPQAVTVNASAKFRQQQEQERRKKERAMEREYQAGLGTASGERYGGAGSQPLFDGRHPGMDHSRAQQQWGSQDQGEYGLGGVGGQTPSHSAPSSSLPSTSALSAQAQAGVQTALATVQNLLALQSLKKLQAQVSSTPLPHSNNLSHPHSSNTHHHTNGFHSLASTSSADDRQHQ